MQFLQEAPRREENPEEASQESHKRAEEEHLKRQGKKRLAHRTENFKKAREATPTQLCRTVEDET